MPVPLRHLFTSDSASSTPDWISDSFCFFFSAEIPPNQQNNQQKLGPPNGIKMGNQIKQGKLAYLHRGRRRRCTCGRGRPRPRSTASRSPRTPRSWLLLAARLDLLPRPAPSKSRGQITAETRSNSIDSAASDRADAGGEFDGDRDPRGWAWGNWEVASTCLIGSGGLGQTDTRGISTLALFVLETAWWARKISGCRGLKQAADGSCGLAASRARHGVWTRFFSLLYFF